MQKLKNKMKKQGGFTLVAILIAISIPMVNSSLEKAKKATDDANLRAAKAVAMIMYLDNAASIKTDDVYDIDKGTFSTATSPKGYNKSTQTKAGESADTAIKAEEAYITVKIAEADETTDEPVKVYWKKAST